MRSRALASSPPRPLRHAPSQRRHRDAAPTASADALGVVRTLEIGSGAPLFVVYPDEEPTTRLCLTDEAIPAELRRGG